MGVANSNLDTSQEQAVRSFSPAEETFRALLLLLMRLPKSCSMEHQMLVRSLASTRSLMSFDHDPRETCAKS